MSLAHAFILGLLQGATEFLPVSSSGHLVLVPWLLGWPAPDLAFDVVVHWGTAFAVVATFWADWMALLRGLWDGIRTRSLANPNTRLAALIVLAGVPAALAGFFLDDFFEQMFSRPVAAAGFLLVTAAVLALAEGWALRERALNGLSWSDGLVIGVAQAAAIFPGISRSGATIAAGMGRGLNRGPAARFSFLLATPTILGAGVLHLLDLAQAQGPLPAVPALLLGFVAALVSGLVCIRFLLRYLENRSLYPFALYCALFGIASLLFVIF